MNDHHPNRRVRTARRHLGVSLTSLLPMFPAPRLEPLTRQQYSEFIFEVLRHQGVRPQEMKEA